MEKNIIITKNNINIEHFHNAFITPSAKETNGRRRRDHLRYIISNEKFINGHILEFGVFQGKSINILAENFNKETIYGFDSFEGLPEDWVTNDGPIKHVKGYFSVDVLPEVKKNVVLVKGFFDQVLEEWIRNSNLNQIRLLHIDSDLYSSAIYVLNTLNEFIVPGSIIIFDELYPWSSEEAYSNWKDGEWKALVEWVTFFDRKFEIVCRNNHQQTAIRIVK
jgi:hypothetical protein